MDIFGEVLLRQFDLDRPFLYAIERDDKFLSFTNAQMYFYEYQDFNENEKLILKSIEGRTIELAAGAGRISKYIQNNLDQIDITASDVSNKALQVCMKRGLKKTMKLDLQNYKNWDEKIKEPVDTFLIFGNSIGVIDKREKMIDFLDTLWTLTSSKGKVFGDFMDPLGTTEQTHLDYQQRNRENNKPPGLVKIRVRFLEFIGEWFNLWLLTLGEFWDIIEQTPWKAQTFGEGLTYFELKK